MMEGEKVRRKVLASLLVIAVVAGLVGASTWAYFSDTETSTPNTFQAGTVNLRLNDGDPDTWADGASATWSSPNWAPGDPEVVAVLRMKNVGSTGAAVARVCAENLTEGGPVGPDNIADYIHVTTINYTENDLWIPANLVLYYEGIFGNNDDTFTLREFVDSVDPNYCMVFWIGWPPSVPEGDGKRLQVTEDYLPANGTRMERVRLGFTFDSGAGNEYQGDWASFDIVVTADDDTFILGEGSSHGY